MPRISKSVPKYRFHKASKQAVVTISGCEIYLGPWQSKPSLIVMTVWLEKWLAAGSSGA
ncbi:MAG: hypothetical protein AAF483_09190 [Planctomycetota bacterium]